MRVVVASFVLLLTACPRDVEDPLRPEGPTCSSDEECTPPDAECGLIYACIDQRCTQEPARAEPCRE